MKYPINFAMRVNGELKAMLNDLALSEGDRPSDAEVMRRLIWRAYEARAYEATEKKQVALTPRTAGNSKKRSR